MAISDAGTASNNSCLRRTATQNLSSLASASLLIRRASSLQSHRLATRRGSGE